MSALVEPFPLPALNKTRWPWIEPSDESLSLCLEGLWPRISVITPSYNQGEFIEETIRSVLLQGYPNLEYIIIDGGSTDDTCNIIKRYESRITYWISEPDRGQTHAINKGIKKATGDILAYINSDDYYLQNTLYKVAEHYKKHAQTDLLHGRCRYVDQKGNKIGEQIGNIQSFEEILDLWGVWWNKRQFVQPEVFWSRRIFRKIGLFNESLHYVMDYEYWMRILRADGVVRYLDIELSCFRFTANQKSNHSNHVANELLEVVKPVFWNKEENISKKNRLKLRSQWLYHALFLKTVEQSIKDQDSRYLRWLKLARVVFSNAEILMSPQLHHRIKASLTGN